MRDKFFDSLKFYLISVVVLIHAISTYNYGPETYGVDFFLQLFAMPLFTFVSGYFFDHNSLPKLCKSTLRLLESLFVYQIIFILYYLFLGRSFQVYWLYTPIWSLWYILSLIFWKVLTYGARRVNQWHTLLVSVFLALIIGFLPIDKALSIQRTFVFYPFFLLGHCFQESELAKRLELNKTKEVHLFLLFAILVLSLIFVKCDLQYIFSCSVSYYSFPCGLLKAVLIRLLYLILSFIVSALFIACIKPIKVCSKLGQQTMKYYLFHPYIVLFFGIAIDKLDLPSNVFAVFVYFIFIMAAITLFNNTAISSFILNPISSLFASLNKSKFRF